MDSTTPVVFQEMQSAPGQATQSEKSIERSQQADQQSYHCWTSEEIENTIYLWEELVSSQVDMKFSAFGASTLPVPTFLSHNVQKVVSSASAQDYQYANITGRSDLVEAILTNFPETKKLQTEQRQLKSSNVLVTMGAINGIQATIEALCSPGDEIIVFEPVYQNHLIAFVNSNVVFKSVKMIFNEKTKKLEFDFETLKSALSAKTKVLLIINPNNPGTRIFTEEEYIKISEIIEEYPSLTVIEDQAYSIYHEDGQKVIPFATIKPSNFDKTVTFFSAGKMFNITGTRVGFCIGAERIISKVGEWFRFKSHFTPALEQMITRENLISATEKDEESRDFYEATRQDISSKMNKIKEELTKYGVNVLPYEGTYYILLDIENQRERVEDKYYFRHHDSNTRTKGLDQAFCRAMLSKYGVGLFALSPLYTGENCPDNIVRVSANRNDNDLQLLFDAFKDFYGLV